MLDVRVVFVRFSDGTSIISPGCVPVGVVATAGELVFSCFLEGFRREYR